VLAEGLRRAGRDLRRERLVAYLERLWAFEPGLGRAVTFGPNRRVGVLGSYVVNVDLAERRLRLAGWVPLDDKPPAAP
jgi:hypothetical protein